MHKILHYLMERGEGSQVKSHCVKCPKTFDLHGRHDQKKEKG